MLIYEFRVVLPMTVEEYQVAQLYSVAEASKNETGGGEGIEVLINEPFPNPNATKESEKYIPDTPLLGGAYTDGQYTHKIYRLSSRLPRLLGKLVKNKLDIHEKAWNAYPYCRTIVTNPDYMKDNFIIKIETIHLPDAGTTENAHQLKPKELAMREVVNIDIANDQVDRKDYKEEWDPSTYHSQKTGRGPLKGDWMKTANPVMCCYKLVTVEFKWWGLQTRVEKFIQKTERRIFTNFHRQVFCWTDQWYGLTMEDIRKIEERTKEELEEQIKSGEIRGTKGGDVE